MELNLYDIIDYVNDGEWKPLNFTIYNHIVDDGYLDNVSALLGEKFGMNDFEYMTLPLDSEESKLIKLGDGETIKWYSNIIYAFEKEVQKDAVYGLFMLRKGGIIFAVRPKGKKIQLTEDFS